MNTVMMTAAEQREKAPFFKKELELKRIKEYKENIVNKINKLWLFREVHIWEEDWFDGLDDFLDEIQDAGYYIYFDTGRKNGCGQTQSFYIVTLNKKNGYYGRNGRIEK